MKRRQSGGRRGVLLLVVSSSVLSVLWLGLTSSVQYQELLIGVLSISLTTLFLCSVYREELQRYDLRAADVLTIWRVPWYVISSLWEIVAVLFLDLVGIERAPSLYRVCGFRSSKDDPVLVTPGSPRYGLHKRRRPTSSSSASITPRAACFFIRSAAARSLS